MKKTITRKKLLKTMDDIVQESLHHPVSWFRIYFADQSGEWDLDTVEEINNIDEFVGRLMELSLSHRIVKISRGFFIYSTSMHVSFTLMKDNEFQTNIDEEFMNNIMGLNLYERTDTLRAMWM